MATLILKFVLFVGFFISGFLLVSNFVQHSKMEIHNEVAGFIYAVVGVIYAVLLAFVVISVWVQYTDAEKNVNTEASHVADIYRNANGFPDSVKKEIQAGAIQYMNDMINYEWKAMEVFQTSEEAKKSYVNMWRMHEKFKPTTAYESIWYAESIKELDELADSRRFRINSINYNIHPFMWLVLYIGAFITIGFTYLFGTKNKIAHIIMVFSLSAVIGLILLLIDSFEHPFTGLIHLTPESFINALKQLM
jgi:Protein of unknown function (DUF4239)